MDGLTLFGLLAVTAMLAFYALEDRSAWFILAFAGACLAGIAASLVLWRGLLGPTPLGLAVAISTGAALYLCVIFTLERQMLRQLRDVIVGN